MWLLSYYLREMQQIVLDPPEKLQKMCPECPVLLEVDSSEARGTALLTLNKYKAQSTLPIGLGLHAITRASSQVTRRSWQTMATAALHDSK